MEKIHQKVQQTAKYMTFIIKFTTVFLEVQNRINLIEEIL